MLCINLHTHTKSPKDIMVNTGVFSSHLTLLNYTIPDFLVQGQFMAITTSLLYQTDFSEMGREVCIREDTFTQARGDKKYSSNVR